MRKDKRNIEYKKITVDLPYSTYLEMTRFCASPWKPGAKHTYYYEFINEAILYYIENNN